MPPAPWNAGRGYTRVIGEASCFGRSALVTHDPALLALAASLLVELRRYAFTHNTSNIELYRFDRSRFEFGVTRVF